MSSHPLRRSSLLHLGLLLLLALQAACGDGAAADTSTGAGGIDAAQDDTVGLSNDASATAPACVAGVTGCADKERYVCASDGSGFVKQPCETGTFCDSGQCVECVTDKDCKDGAVCNVEGKCKSDRLTLTTESLPSGLVGTAYKFDLTATGGKGPYIWTVIKGSLSAGLALGGSSGQLAGMPTAAMDGQITIEVKDQTGTTDAKDFALKIADAGLVITTGSPLKNGTDGQPYSATFAAAGGTPPYFWGLSGGALPAGLSLSSDGKLTGTINGDGKFGFDIKVFDSGETTLKATKHFDLTVGLAPLDIVGTQQVDLYVAKLIVLPLIVVASGLPVPYSAKLEATGGKKPYHWKEVPMQGVSMIIKNTGIPKGLNLADDGGLSGSVTDPSLVVTVDLSFLKFLGVNIPNVSGFFFSAQVSDSQNPAANKTGLFVIPTVPIGGP